jgi:cysteinyl-tRNA synthetase
MATVWMHNGFLQVEGRKMSKSEGNFVTINELLATEKFGVRTWPGEVLRLAMLMTHYREPIDFSVKRLEEAFNISRSWFTLLGNLEISDFRRAPSEGLLEQLADDLNTPAAISHIVRQQTHAHSSIEALKQLGADIAFLGLAALKVQQIRDLPPITATANIFDDDDVVEASATVKNLLSEINEMEIENQISKRATFLSNGEYSEGSGNQRTGYNLGNHTLNAPLSAAVQALVDLRLEMLKAKNFAEADRIRDELADKGIQLKDGKDKETGERVTVWEVKR